MKKHPWNQSQSLFGLLIALVLFVVLVAAMVLAAPLIFMRSAYDRLNKKSAAPLPMLAQQLDLGAELSHLQNRPLLSLIHSKKA